MDKQIVTIYTCDTSLRLMVADGKQIKQWAELPLEPGIIQNNVVVKEAELTSKLKQLFEVQKVKTKKIIVGVSGLHCLTRPIILPQLPEVMLDEAVKREAERALPVPLEQLHISWQTIPAPEGKTHIFLTAIPCRIADPLLEALDQVGLKPSFMDLKPLLLARVVDEETTVIVDVQTTDFDIVIMVDGIPQPIRTIPFRNEALSWQEKLPIIRDELDRTITFYNTNNPESLLESSIPIFVSGDLDNESEFRHVLSGEVGHPVLPISSPLDCPEGFDPSPYVTNIGLTLQHMASGKKIGPSVVNMNALPMTYRPKPISLVNILALPGAAIAAGLLVFLILFVQNTSTDIALMRAQLDTTEQLFQQSLSQKKELTGHIIELQKELTEVEAYRKSFAVALGSLEQQSVGVNRDLEVTVKSLPSTMSVSSINHENSILTISGWAPSEQEVLSYILRLDSSGRFGDIAITNMTRIEDDGMEFTLLGSIQTESDRVSSIEVAVNSLPSTVSLTSVTATNGTLTIYGTSPNEDDVLSYFQNLEASGRFREIAITTMARIEGGGTEFALVLKIGE